MGNRSIKQELSANNGHHEQKQRSPKSADNDHHEKKQQSPKSVGLYDIMMANRDSIDMSEEEFREMKDNIQRASTGSACSNAFIA